MKARRYCGWSLGLALGLAALFAGAARPAEADDAGARRTSPGQVAPPDLEDVEHMCALLTGCGDKLPFPAGLVPRDMPGCVRAMAVELASANAVAFSLTLRECGLRASSCGELRTCALRGARPEACAGRGKNGPVDLCDGDGRAITCVNERIAAVRDCPRGGEQCAVRDGKAVCALGPCPTDGPPACSPSGTRILECKKGKLTSFDCGAFGLRCVTTADGPKCATQGATCAEGATRCDGATAIACLHGHEVKIDCASSGMTCGAGNGTAVGACVLPAPSSGACDPSKPARCNGASVEYCAFGAPRTYLCKSVGLGRCLADDKGARCGT
jgi:hypothetical protein